MKNSMAIFFLLFFFACNKQNEPLVDNYESSTGNAFILKNSSIDNITRIDSFIIESPQDSDFFYSKYYFDLNIDFYVLENYDFLSILHPPFLDYYYAHSGYYSLAVEQDSLEKHSMQPQVEFQSNQKYEHLIMLEPETDGNPMYFGAVGLFLQEYLFNAQESNPGNVVKIGFYSSSNNAVEVESQQLMEVFYEKTNSATKQANQYFPTRSANDILHEIEQGINIVTSSGFTDKQLTIITYSLFDTAGLDQQLLKDLQQKLANNNEITLNTISMLPVDFLQPLVYQSDGFHQTDISFLSNINDFQSNAYEFQQWIGKGIFASSVTIQNMERLISSQSKKFNRYSVRSQLTTYQNITTDSMKQIMASQFYHINWKSDKDYLSREIDVKPNVN